MTVPTASVPTASVAIAAPDRTVMRLRARLFPQLGALTSRDWQAALSHDPAFAHMIATRAQRLSACGDTACRIAAAAWQPDEQAVLVAAIAGIAKHTPALTVPANADLPRDASLSQELDAVNGILAVYGAGKPPLHPAIDGPVFAAGSKPFADDVDTALVTAALAAGSPASVAGSLTLAATLLDDNDRDDAISFPDLDARANAGAKALAARTDWARWRYTALIVPGAGPEDPRLPLSARGKLRVMLAANLFEAGLAPFILVSGGAVHPGRTEFVEAVEMKQALMTRYGIPADRIILEPHARHTTTNLRNATRRFASLGIPLDRPALIVTDADQSAYIASTAFHDRNARELGYQPGTLGRRLSAYALAFTPSPSSLRNDPRDPLDP